ncbi:MAG: hypothetical protein UY17_C0036G0008 [Candidatus Beckwithbacteria bacterium GW2011_GWC2_47_9]|uniref:Ribbon-helix-helix protein CopG domain-containing protein n=2 Tax=Patescibacteria group TaxID=1783273 RepID=A0A0G1Q7F2_9BACT|nr:MAG: hypothetical protein UW71_C0018G0008 [Parcubacteria group bacterium GW2011_GWB1_44_7]KKU04515.1 MAG: hypothetical protein UX06_C0016G0008 [Candidatus Giovannonibacteria bacterium GW2011_GWA2_45_21]KKU86929.1 MAG: hypothetical protein UY17_C0036G0008 [Candidatus Beckwithbacteria bacterium GW2011_GWC2_47_9]
MTTISVPLPPNLENFINQQVKAGKAPNKAEVVRRAIMRLSEAEAVNAVLNAQNEPTLKGDLRRLMKKI